MIPLEEDAIVGTLTKLIRAVWPLMLSLGLAACGSDDKKADATNTCTGADCKPGTGFVTKVKDGKIVVDLTGVEAGAQFVMMPYLLGKVEGAAATDTAQKFTFTAKSGTGAGLKLWEAPQARAAQDDTQKAWAIDHDQRTLLNRFDAQKGLEQGADFWTLARSIDVRSGRAGQASLIGSKVARASAETFFQHAATARHSRRSLAAATTAGCPTTTLTVPAEDLTADTVTISNSMTVVEGTDYCIVYVDTPVTESDKTAIEATVKAVMATNKNTIYKNQLLPAASFTFKPIIAVIDFTGAHWPNDAADLQVAGVYLSAMAEEVKQPMLYMASDFGSMPKFKGQEPQTLKNLWHSTVAHEMQHAIMDYFRKRVNSPRNLETPAIDEGIAHFMEDAWGYGSENFDGFPKKFLETWTFGNTPFLSNTDTSSSSRGAAQTLFFYLASQKGGVTFTSGRMSGGDGLDFIASVVTNTSGTGAQGVAAKAAGDWTETMGNYLGSLILDGAVTTDLQAQYKTQGPVTTVTDLNGNEGKTFGMHFNNFGGLTTATAGIQDDAKLGAAALSVELTYYQSKPILYTVAGDAANVTFTLPEGTAADDLSTAAVSAVRVK